ncbi:MAG: hypothetical protein L0G59_03705 [Kocuria sp.]|nr:hypothetical protein [Kocuria sp.]
MAGVEFGMTLWGRAWLRIVERISSAPSPKLPNARRLARGIDDAIRVESGLITAVIETNSVEIAVPLWTENELATVEEKLSSSNVRGAGGDLPDALVEDVKTAGVDIACELDRLQVTCTCRSRTDKCVHVFAAIYGAVLAIDQQPTRAVIVRSPRRESGRTLIDSDWIALEDIEVGPFFALPR